MLHKKYPKKIGSERKESFDFDWKRHRHLKQSAQTASGAVTAKQFAKGHSPWAASWHRRAMAKVLCGVVLASYCMTLLCFSTMLNAETQLHMAVQGWLDFPPPSTEASVLGGRWGEGGGGRRCWKAPSSTLASRRDISPQLSFPQMEHFYTSAYATWNSFVASDSEIPSLDGHQTHVKVRRDGVPFFFLFGEVRKDESFLQSVVKNVKFEEFGKRNGPIVHVGRRVYVRQTWGNFTQWVMKLKQVSASPHMEFTVLCDLLTPEVTGAVQTLYCDWSQPRSQNDSYVTCCTILLRGENPHKLTVKYNLHKTIALSFTLTLYKENFC